MGQAFVSTGSQTVPVEGTLLENVEIKINNGESDLDHYIIKTLARLSHKNLQLLTGSVTRAK